MPVYESDPHAAPDEEFEPGELAHLVPGNRGRMLDPRRTPIVVTGLLPSVGMFEVEVSAFEDAGARWELPIEKVENFQFARGSARAASDVVAGLEETVRDLGRPLTIACRDEDRWETEERIRAERERARAFLAGSHFGRSGRLDLSSLEGDAALIADLADFMAARGLNEVERAFAERFVSNPGSGELVKGHAIVLAHLGLCPYDGKTPRAPDLFAGEWSEERRAEHIVSRLAFVRATFALAGLERVTLYRGLAAEEPITPSQPASFVSATFDRRVAEAHFAGGPKTVAAALYRRAVPVERLFMTYLETEAMNRQFKEAEAVLLGDADDPMF